jgi:hypothetical protein
VEAIVPSDVSVFSGGLISRLMRRSGFDRRAQIRVRIFSIFLAPVAAWVPLLLLTAAAGALLPKSVGSPFLPDIGVHIRLLVVLPLLILAGLVAEQRIRPTVQQFVSRKMIPDDKMDEFRDIVASTFRLGDSVVADVAILAFSYAVVTPLFWRTHVVPTVSWYDATPGPGIAPTLAGLWFIYVSLPMFQFLLLRWYYRLFIWTRFLGRTARLDLRLIPTHPDRLGGLGFLILATQGLSLFAMAHGVLLAGWVANRVLIGKEVLTEFKGEIALLLGFVLCITILPLLAYMRPLLIAKRRGTFAYGALAAMYARDFDDKWIRSGGNAGEPLIGSADIQSMADMGGTYELVSSMRSTPISVQLLISMSIATLLPVLPLLLTIMPLEQLLKKLVGILLP